MCVLGVCHVVVVVVCGVLRVLSVVHSVCVLCVCVMVCVCCACVCACSARVVPDIGSVGVLQCL